MTGSIEWRGVRGGAKGLRGTRGNGAEELVVIERGGERGRLGGNFGDMGGFELGGTSGGTGDFELEGTRGDRRNRETSSSNLS